MTSAHVRYDHTVKQQGQSEARLTHTASALIIGDMRAEGRTLKDSHNCNCTQCKQYYCWACEQYVSFRLSARYPTCPCQIKQKNYKNQLQVLLQNLS